MIETPAFDDVLAAVQSWQTREFRWFIGQWAKVSSQGLLWSQRTKQRITLPEAGRVQLHGDLR